MSRECFQSQTRTAKCVHAGGLIENRTALGGEGCREGPDGDTVEMLVIADPLHVSCRRFTDDPQHRSANRSLRSREIRRPGRGRLEGLSARAHLPPKTRNADPRFRIGIPGTPWNSGDTILISVPCPLPPRIAWPEGSAELALHRLDERLPVQGPPAPFMTTEKWQRRRTSPAAGSPAG